METDDIENCFFVGIKAGKYLNTCKVEMGYCANGLVRKPINCTSD